MHVRRGDAIRLGWTWGKAKNVEDRELLSNPTPGWTTTLTNTKDCKHVIVFGDNGVPDMLFSPSQLLRQIHICTRRTVSGYSFGRDLMANIGFTRQHHVCDHTNKRTLWIYLLNSPTTDCVWRMFRIHLFCTNEYVPDVDVNIPDSSWPRDHVWTDLKPAAWRNNPKIMTTRWIRSEVASATDGHIEVQRGPNIDSDSDVRKDAEMVRARSGTQPCHLSMEGRCDSRTETYQGRVNLVYRCHPSSCGFTPRFITRQSSVDTSIQTFKEDHRYWSWVVWQNANTDHVDYSRLRCMRSLRKDMVTSSLKEVTEDFRGGK